MPKFRRVTGLFRAATPDGPDTDYTPELEALNGQIEFTPRHRDGVIAYPHLDPPEFVRPEPIQAVLQDGYVMTQVSVGEETVIQPVELLVSDDDEATQSWQWEEVFRDIRVGRWGDEITISPLRFTVPDEDGPLDLTEVVGEKSGGTITVKGPRGEGITDLRAENGQLIVEWGAGKQLTIPVPEAVPGPKGEPGEPGETGLTGPKGDGVPDGGEAGQLLWHAGNGARWVAFPELTTPNLIPNGDLSKGMEGWPAEASFSTDAPPGLTGSAVAPPLDTTLDMSGLGQWEVTPGEVIAVEAWVKANKPGSRMYLEMRDQAKRHLANGDYPWTAVEGSGPEASTAFPIGGYTVPTEWTRLVQRVTVRPGVTMARFRFWFTNHSSGSERTATQSIAGLRLYRVGSLRSRIDQLEARIAELEA